MVVSHSEICPVCKGSGKYKEYYREQSKETSGCTSFCYTRTCHRL